MLSLLCLLLVALSIANATHFQFSRIEELPLWFWGVLTMMLGHVLLSNRYLKAGRPARWFILKWGLYMAAFFFPFRVMQDALEPQIAWGSVVFMTTGGLLTGLAMGANIRKTDSALDRKAHGS